MTQPARLVNYDGLSRIERCFVLGAGASYDAGVPVERRILPAAEWCAEFLQSKECKTEYEERALVRIRALLELARNALDGSLDSSLDPLYSKLDESDRHILNWLVVFLLSRVGCTSSGGFCYRWEKHEPDAATSYRRMAKVVSSRDAILTFNYDTFLEQGISPPFKLHYGSCIAAWPHEDRYPILGRDEEVTLRVLRLHGSAGWLTCSKCSLTEDFGMMPINELGIEEETVRAHDVDAYCPRCMREVGVSSMGLDAILHDGMSYDLFEREHCMVLPAAEREYDREPLRSIWGFTEKALAVCDQIIIVGYSLPAVDKAFKAVVDRALKVRESHPKLLVVDPAGDTGDAWKNISTALGHLDPQLSRQTFSQWLDGNGA